jgi:hypothetical protein
MKELSPYSASEPFGRGPKIFMVGECRARDEKFVSSFDIRISDFCGTRSASAV